MAAEQVPEWAYKWVFVFIGFVIAPVLGLLMRLFEGLILSRFGQGQGGRADCDNCRVSHEVVALRETVRDLTLRIDQILTLLAKGSSRQ